MFVQIFKGPVSDAATIRAALDRWAEELAPGADGWLGSTGGVTDDGVFVGIARFESAEAARRNSDRTEQGEWWAQTSAAFTGDVTFQNSTSVDVDTAGDPDSAGFVQVMEGRGKDPDRAREIMSQDSDKWAAFRPEVLGTLVANHDDGQSFTMVIYFPSEEAAREGEQKEIPEELKANMDELNSLMTGEPTYYDLRDPWLLSP
jgi:hypothetical protein